MNAGFLEIGDRSPTAMQVARAGSDPQRTEAAEILSEARKKLYALLAEG